MRRLTVFFCALFALPAAAQTQSPSGLLFVANQGNHTALLVDAASGKPLFTAGVDINGHEVAVSPDRRFGYVPIYSNVGVGSPGTNGATIQVVDLQAGRVVDIINLPKPVRPHLARFGSDGLLYVSAELANAVYAVDVHSKKVVAELPTGQPESHMFALSPDAKHLYTANVSSGTVSVVDIRNKSLVTVIPVAKRIQRISISPDGRYVFTQDQVSPRIAVIDTSTNTIMRWLDVGEIVYSSAVTPDGRHLIANSTKGKLFVLNLPEGNTEKTYDIAESIGAIAVSSDGAYAFVTCPVSGVLEVLNLTSWKLEPPIQLTPGVDGLAWLPAVPR